MFDKIKQMAQAKGLSDEIKKEEVVVDKNGVRVVVGGDFTLKDIVLNDNLNSSEQAESIKEAFNEAVKELQMKMAKKMMGMGM